MAGIINVVLGVGLVLVGVAAPAKVKV